MTTSNSPTATLVRNLPTGDAKFPADQKLYMLSIPVSYGSISALRATDYVVVSAVCNKYAHETYIFPADENGNILSFVELPGSYRGGTQHDKALRRAGFEVIS